MLKAIGTILLLLGIVIVALVITHSRPETTESTSPGGTNMAGTNAAGTNTAQSISRERIQKARRAWEFWKQLGL